MDLLTDVILSAALPQLSEDLHATPTITNLSVAMYMLSMSIFPLWWSSFSESLGRRTIYLLSFALYILWAILSAVSTSIGMLVVMRILSGGAAASVQAVGAGTIADIWESRERGRAMGIFYLGPLMGPLLAPIIGGALSQGFGWRSTMWFLAIYGGVIWILLATCLPETLSWKNPLVTTTALPTNTNEKNSATPQLTRVSTRQFAQQKAKTFASVFHRCIIEPLYILAYLRFPAVALTVYYASITFGSLYVLNIGIQQTFSQPPYSFPVSILGLLYIPGSLGYIVASVIGGKWSDIIMHREARRANRYDANGKLILIPEDRMRENAYIAAALYPGALIWYGWATQYHLHWAVAAVANFFFGLGSMVIFSVSTTMLTEFMPRKSSSGVAVNNFMRNIFSCVGGVIASPLIDAIGSGWLFTALGLLAWLSGVVMWAMRRYGPRWREQMDNAMKY
jgi:multidrug resistance protein